jgi:hypothetical protein
MDVVSIRIAPLDELLAMLQPHDVGEHPVGNALRNHDKLCMMPRRIQVHRTSKSKKMLQIYFFMLIPCYSYPRGEG